MQMPRILVALKFLLYAALIIMSAKTGDWKTAIFLTVMTVMDIVIISLREKENAEDDE